VEARHVARLRFKVHAVIQMDERGLSVEDVRIALANGKDIESRPDDQPYPARLVLGLCTLGAPDPALWEPDLETRRKSR
jgi:Domain of unknown function (DUF4258)